MKKQPNTYKCHNTLWRNMTDREKKIYNAVKANFPKASHESALDIAIQGGAK